MTSVLLTVERVAIEVDDARGAGNARAGLIHRLPLADAQAGGLDLQAMLRAVRLALAVARQPGRGLHPAGATLA